MEIVEKEAESVPVAKVALIEIGADNDIVQLVADYAIVFLDIVHVLGCSVRIRKRFGRVFIEPRGYQRNHGRLAGCGYRVDK
jgi:hypothetical protein